MCMQIWNIRRLLDRWYLQRFLYNLPSLWPVIAETVVCLPKLSSVKIAARWCSLLVWGVGPDQSEAGDDTQLCPGSGTRVYPQIAPQLPAWRRGEYGRMCPDPVRDIRGDVWKRLMTCHHDNILPSYCSNGIFAFSVKWERKGGEGKCILEYLVLDVWSSQLPGGRSLPPSLASRHPPLLRDGLETNLIFPSPEPSPQPQPDHRDSAVNRKYISHGAGEHQLQPLHR